MKKRLNSPVMDKVGNLILAIMAVTFIVCAIVAAVNGNAIAHPVTG